MNTSTRELVFQLSHGFCMCEEDCFEKADEVHHKLANTKVNKEKFPLFIDSIFNLCPINHGCHMSKTVPRISDHEAGIYEKWLMEQFTKKH